MSIKRMLQNGINKLSSKLSDLHHDIQKLFNIVLDMIEGMIDDMLSVPDMIEEMIDDDTPILEDLIGDLYDDINHM
jgi:hypothetical protein